MSEGFLLTVVLIVGAIIAGFLMVKIYPWPRRTDPDYNPVSPFNQPVTIIFAYLVLVAVCTIVLAFPVMLAHEHFTKQKPGKVVEMYLDNKRVGLAQWAEWEKVKKDIAHLQQEVDGLKKNSTALSKEARASLEEKERRIAELTARVHNPNERKFPWIFGN